MSLLATIQTTFTTFTPPWRTTALSTEDIRGLKNRASRARERGRFDRAQAIYQELEQREPHEGDWSRRLAEIHRRLGKTDDAIQALERGLGKYLRAGFCDKATATCNLIVRLDPDNAAARAARARL